MAQPSFREHASVEGSQSASPKQPEYLNNIDALAEKGCKVVTLFTVLHLAATVGELLDNDVAPSPRSSKSIAKAKQTEDHDGFETPMVRLPSAEVLARTASKLSSLADEIELLERSGVMRPLDGKEIEQSEAKRGVDWHERRDMRRVFPHLHLPFWLNKRARMYEEWVHFIREDAHPKNLRLQQWKFVYPALYVKHATKSAHNELVWELLRSAGLRCPSTSKQLGDDVNEFVRRHPLTTSEMKMQFSMIDNGELRYTCEGIDFLE